VRLAVLSDIHGNVLALEAVVADARAQGVARFGNLGDTLYGPLWPRETYELLRRLDVAFTVRGNQDRDVFEDPPTHPVHPATRRFVRDAIGPDAIDWLSAFPATATWGDALACHGTPASDTTYLLEHVGPGEGAVPLRDGDAIDALLAGVAEPLVLCGHSHVARCVRTPAGRLVVNPGSVGLPAYDDAAPYPHAMQAGSPDAAYAIVESAGAGLIVRHVRVPYDHARAAARAEENGRDDWAAWLATGRAALATSPSRGR
jgi:predicted phosphodiesterase